jgi:hypothetical protein
MVSWSLIGVAFALQAKELVFEGYPLKDTETVQSSGILLGSGTALSLRVFVQLCSRRVSVLIFFVAVNYIPNLAPVRVSDDSVSMAIAFRCYRHRHCLQCDLDSPFSAVKRRLQVQIEGTRRVSSSSMCLLVTGSAGNPVGRAATGV